MKFSDAEEFELHVHKCFGKIFEGLTKMDGVIKKTADEEEDKGNYGEWSDLRDWIEEVILHCHLAWQYHRLSRMSGGRSTWERLDERKPEEIAARLGEGNPE